MRNTRLNKFDLAAPSNLRIGQFWRTGLTKALHQTFDALCRKTLACLLLGFAHLSLAQQVLPQSTLNINNTNLRVEIAHTPEQQQQGLMFRNTLAENHGMLFIFDTPQPLCFWMKNTLIPLSIAFLDEKMRVVNIADMRPLDETTHCAASPSQYALEVNQGWFTRHSIRQGQIIKLPTKP